MTTEILCNIQIANVESGGILEVVGGIFGLLALIMAELATLVLERINELVLSWSASRRDEAYLAQIVGTRPVQAFDGVVNEGAHNARR